MKKNVLIDPYMFYIKDEKHIKDSIDFFDAIAELCLMGNVSICIYKDIFEKINNRGINPFPIKISDIQDRNLKEKIVTMNNIFCGLLLKNFVCIDIDECKGEQEFRICPEELAEDSKYYELCSIILCQCYNEKVKFEDIVITNSINGKLVLGQEINVCCTCSCKTFDISLKVAEPNTLFSEEYWALHNIEKILSFNSELYVDNPVTVRGQHHNELQDKEIHCFADLKRKNKRVLAMLRSFGLSKIIFGKFRPDTSVSVGDIIKCSVTKGTEADIVQGEFYSYTGFQFDVDLYFPKGMGQALCNYTKNEFTYMKIEKLRTKLQM